MEIMAGDTILISPKAWKTVVAEDKRRYFQVDWADEEGRGSKFLKNLCN